MWSIAWKTLFADRGKLLTALVGVVFSVVLVNLQGGLFFGLIGKAGLLVDRGQADIWVGHRHMHNVDFAQDIPTRWVHRLRGIPGVRRVEPYLVGWATMTLPSGGFESVIIVGHDAESGLGGAWNLCQADPSRVRQTDGIFVDQLEQEKLENPKVGDVREISGRRARVVGQTRGVMGFLVAPYVFTTFQRAAGYLLKRDDVASYYLVELEENADAQAVCAAIRRRVPQLDALPSDQFSRMSQDFWMKRTGLGISFGAATLMGLLVGVVMVAQTLYASVLDRLDEFAALKAMGASEKHLYGMLFFQCCVIAGLGSVAGLAVVTVMQRLYSSPIAPIMIPWWLSLGSCTIVFVICLASSTLPYMRIRRLDPAIVLQS